MARVRRRFSGRRTAWLFMVATAGLAATLGIFISTRRDPADWARNTEARQWSVMSFNILRGGKPAGAALDAIAAAAPDLLCLQELTPGLARDFEARLGDLYPHRLFEARPGVSGVGIASRHPLGDGEVLTLGLTYLPAVSATVRPGADAIRVACVHLLPPHAGFKGRGNLWRKYRRNERLRVRQAERLLRHLDTAGGPALILGDMNEWPGQAAVSLIGAAGFNDACGGGAARCGPTWPGRTIPLPAMFRIDHIYGRGVAFEGTAILEAGGSDHYPVAARVHMRKEPVVVAVR